MQKRTVLLCMGTRPEIIKMAPVYHALDRTELKPVILHTGQHNELASPFYEFFNLKPEYDLSLEHTHTSISQLLATIISGLDSVLQTLHPSAMLVQGDTSSALAGALTAYYHKIPVGHIEAGLRSHNAYAPFPEEKNRELIARIAKWNFVPTSLADKNLHTEGISEASRYQVGNTIVDAVNWGLSHLENNITTLKPDTPDTLKWVTQIPAQCPLLLVTVHRRESWYGDIAQIAEAIRDIIISTPDVHVLWLVHPNPLVKNAIQQIMSDIDPTNASRIFLSNPLNYPELLWVLQKAWLILTDSGGLQEEAVSINKPVLILRNSTERPEVVDSGCGVLIGTATNTIKEWVNKLLADEQVYNTMQSSVNPFGDGHAGQYIAEILQQELSGIDSGSSKTGEVKYYD
ncbi:MAG: UDP-N-acetylglucosamine 2-epimerase (non-hydrolyzing) [Gammaproteobacteria bacterium]|nr:UDP-N-acetylglucosamine 2-epimerase (non-hydrolyzing) [Gammaproteobacteria bacterium]